MVEMLGNLSNIEVLGAITLGLKILYTGTDYFLAYGIFPRYTGQDKPTLIRKNKSFQFRYTVMKKIIFLPLNLLYLYLICSVYGIIELLSAY